MVYPNTDWPVSVDNVVTRTDLVNTVWADDFNYPDEQIRTIQSWLGEDGDLIGDDGTVTHGPGGMVSPVADGGVAFKLAARAAYTSGKLLSVGDDEDVLYVEKFAIESTGLLSVAGVVNYEALVTADDDIPNKKYVDDAILGEDFWDRTGTVIHPNTAGDTLAIGAGVIGAVGYGFDGFGDTGMWLKSTTPDVLAWSNDGTESATLDATGFALQINLQQFFSQAGAVGAPGYSFVGFGDTGSFLSSTGPDVISWTCDGGLVANLSAASFQTAGQILTPDGAVGAPAFSLSGFPDSGLYLETDTPDVLAFSADGAKILSISAAQMLNVNGLVGAPAYSFIGDPDSGLYWIAANSFGVTLNGALRTQWTTSAMQANAGKSYYLKHSAGTVLLPTYAFNLYSDTGMFLESDTPDVIGLSCDGAKVLGIAATGLELMSYAKAALPAATATGSLIYVTDEVGGAVPAFSDGAAWRRVTDRAVVS